MTLKSENKENSYKDLIGSIRTSEQQILKSKLRYNQSNENIINIEKTNRRGKGAMTKSEV